MLRLTTQQTKLWNILFWSVTTDRRVPSRRELTVALGISPKSLHWTTTLIEQLEAQGLFRRCGKHRSRAIEILPLGRALGLIVRCDVSLANVSLHQERSLPWAALG